MEKKMTKNDFYDLALSLTDVQANSELVDFFKHQKELLARKNTSDKKKSKEAIALNELRKQVLAEMEEGKEYTATEMLKVLPCFADFYSTQKVMGVINKLIAEGKIIRSEKAKFSLPTEKEENI